jgi:uncharacterized protein YbjT (DUF2867 family)
MSVVMIGATGAVGSVVASTLAAAPQIRRLTLLGRRPLDDVSGSVVSQHTVDLSQTDSYRDLVAGHDVAICTLGVGEPSRMSREEFVRIDKKTPLDFAVQCRRAGVGHFALLGSVGASTTSRSFYLRSKGELEEELGSLGFERLSLFRPSMILTPTNRYGITQAITLAVWPVISPLLPGSLSKYRGIRVEQLGRAIAMKALTTGQGRHVMHWNEIVTLASSARDVPHAAS